MEELEQQLNSILSDPKQLEQIAGLARSLMGGEKPEQSAPASSDLGFDPALLRRIGSLMQDGGDSRAQALLKALAPYLSDKRREKLDSALKLAKLARIARLAMGEGGDEAL